MGRKSAIGRHAIPADDDSDPPSLEGAGRPSRQSQAMGRPTGGATQAPAKPGVRLARYARLFVAGLVLLGTAYYGIGAAAVYFRYWQLVNDMKVDAELAANMNDQVIRRRLLASVDRLGLPADAGKFQIRRTRTPPMIELSTTYEETILLPFYQATVTFSPEVSARLPRTR